MNKDVPDVASNEAPQFRVPLEWAGISRIDWPIHLSEPGCRGPVHAVVDAQINLPTVAVKGVHTPRIYRMLDEMFGQEAAISPRHLRKLLEQMFDSHHDCYTYGVKVALNFSLLARRAALRSPERASRKAYPVQLEAMLDWETFSLRASVQVAYSSTCPCSADLTRQLIAQFFWADFPRGEALAREQVSEWLEQNATPATPHSQRSEAHVSVDVPGSASEFGLVTLIDQVEAVLATPVQTAVERADEQAFAWLNGQSLMYVEDAARRLQGALRDRYDNLQTHVRHLESLHPHDAVAFASGDFQGVS